MLDPIIFPIEISFSFFTAAIIDEANSGTLVPIDTTVTAITLLLTPNPSASCTAPSTNNSEPNQSAKPPYC